MYTKRPSFALECKSCCTRTMDKIYLFSMWHRKLRPTKLSQNTETQYKLWFMKLSARCLNFKGKKYLLNNPSEIWHILMQWHDLKCFAQFCWLKNLKQFFFLKKLMTSIVFLPIQYISLHLFYEKMS